MNKIRIIILSLIVVLVTGCQREYNLIVSDNEIIEDINVVLPDTESNSKMAEMEYYPIHANNNITYSKEIEKSNENLNINLKYTYRPKDFVNANSVNECFFNKEIIVDNDKYYYFKLEKMKPCVTDYNFDINIITNNVVYKHNADSVKNNKYTWHLSDENKDTFYLEIKIAKGTNKKDRIITICTIVAISLLIIIVAMYIFSKKNKSNKI